MVNIGLSSAVSNKLYNIFCLIYLYEMYIFKAKKKKILYLNEYG